MTMDEEPGADGLRIALAYEVDRPGLDGPSLDAVLHAAAGRVRRRRVTLGATFALAAVAVGTTVTLSERDATGPANNSAAAAAAAVAASSAGAAAAQFPTDVVENTGTVDGKTWQLVLTFQHPKDKSGKTDQAVWCGRYTLYASGNGSKTAGAGITCAPNGKELAFSPDLKHGGPDYSNLLTTEPQRLGGIPDGEVTSVAVQCSNGNEFPSTPSQPKAGGPVHYTLTFPSATACPSGTLTFYDASHQRIAHIDGLAFETANSTNSTKSAT